VTPKHPPSTPYYPKADKRDVSPSVKKPRKCKETIPGCPNFIPANLSDILLLCSIVLSLRSKTYADARFYLLSSVKILADNLTSAALFVSSGTAILNTVQIALSV